MTEEYIRKVDAADWLKQYGQDVLHRKYKFSLMYIWKNIMDRLNKLYFSGDEKKE